MKIIGENRDTRIHEDFIAVIQIELMLVLRYRRNRNEYSSHDHTTRQIL